MIDKETLEYSAKSRYIELEYGVESVNEHVLRLTNKKQDERKIIKAFELTK